MRPFLLLLAAAFALTGASIRAEEAPRRRDINDMPPAERVELFDAIAGYPEIIDAHAHHGRHGGASFYWTHKKMVNDLEDYLRRNGFPQFSPLPGWDPARPVPAEFRKSSRGEGLFGVSSTAPRPEEAKAPAFCEKKPYFEIGPQLMHWHFKIHEAAGIGHQDANPSVYPIFWCAHAMLTDVFEEWSACSGSPIDD